MGKVAKKKCGAMLKNGNYPLKLQNNEKSLEEVGFVHKTACSAVEYAIHYSTVTF